MFFFGRSDQAMLHGPIRIGYVAKNLQLQGLFGLIELALGCLLILISSGLIHKPLHIQSPGLTPRFGLLR